MEWNDIVERISSMRGMHMSAFPDDLEIEGGWPIVDGDGVLTGELLDGNAPSGKGEKYLLTPDYCFAILRKDAEEAGWDSPDEGLATP